MSINKIKSIFWKIYSFGSNEYKKNYYGSFSFWRLLLVNIAKPGRFLNRLRYGQLFKNHKKSKDLFKKNYLNNHKINLSEIKKEKLSKALDDLIKFGGCVIPEYFSDEEINKLKETNKDKIKSLIKDQDENINNNDILPLSTDLIKIWLDDGILSLIKVFFGTNVYARNYPYAMYTKVASNYEGMDEAGVKKMHWAKDWHVDHSVLFNVHVVLEDINEEGSRMQILKNSDKFHHYGSNFSDELVSNKNFEKLECIGKKGTVYLHSGNVVHRFKAEPGTDRLITHFEFSPGSNILLNTKGIVKSLNNGYDLDTLDHRKMEIIYPLFPRKLDKGYDIKKNSYQPTRFRGI